jgi:cytidylate kinase
MTVAVSRQAGARGGTLGRRVGRLLGWDVYGQELLEYLAREPSGRQEVCERLSPAASNWVENRLHRLLHDHRVDEDPSLVDLVRVILGLGARGEVVLIGRGAGFLLPAASTLHVRIVAPWDDRVAYMAQWLRLTDEEAADEVRRRDARRAEFLAAHFHGLPLQAEPFDLCLNSRLLGEETCAELVVQAVRAKAGVSARPASDPDLA